MRKILMHGMIQNRIDEGGIKTLSCLIWSNEIQRVVRNCWQSLCQGPAYGRMAEFSTES